MNKKINTLFSEPDYLQVMNTMVFRPLGTLGNECAFHCEKEMLRLATDKCTYERYHVYIGML